MDSRNTLKQPPSIVIVFAELDGIAVGGADSKAVGAGVGTDTRDENIVVLTAKSLFIVLEPTVKYAVLASTAPPAWAIKFVVATLKKYVGSLAQGIVPPLATSSRNVVKSEVPLFKS